MVAEPSDDHRLVAGVRRGDDRAFEALYARYHRRIHAYIVGMVKDHGRAEDVTQEVFLSALRRMRETERPIAFKPWIYEIAKNACIDQFRRSRRAEEVSLQADEGLAPGDYLVGSEPTPDAAVAAKQDLDHLCGAFGGLSDAHHEILVLRELEGLSYREIGDRMGMSRPAVESTLFRARRRLTEEYDELVSGARCQRILGLIAMAADSRLGTRESRRLSRHVAHCQPCRREALAAGLDSAILTHVPLRRRAAEKVAALLPFGWLGRWRGGDSGASSSLTGSGGAGGRWAAHFPMLSDQLSGPWGKAATAAAVLVAGVGAAGVGTQVAGSDELPRGGDRPAPAQRTGSAAAGGGEDARARAARATLGSTTTSAKPKASKRTEPNRRARRETRAGDGGSGAAQPAGPSSGGGGTVAAAGGGTGGGSALPEVKLPSRVQDPAAPVKETVDRVVETVQPVVEGVTDTVEQVTQPVQGTVQGTTEGVGETVQGTTDRVGQSVQGTTDRVGQTVQGTTDRVGQTVEGATGALLP
jgi:RNA polymerase sigma factor (sigma-70 family)